MAATSDICTIKTVITACRGGSDHSSVYSAPYLWLYAKAPVVCTCNNNWLAGSNQ